MELNPFEKGVDGSKTKVLPENKSYLSNNPARKENYSDFLEYIPNRLLFLITMVAHSIFHLTLHKDAWSHHALLY